jgi:hypothetical protein
MTKDADKKKWVVVYIDDDGRLLHRTSPDVTHADFLAASAYLSIRAHYVVPSILEDSLIRVMEMQKRMAEDISELAEIATIGTMEGEENETNGDQ